MTEKKTQAPKAPEGVEEGGNALAGPETPKDAASADYAPGDQQEPQVEDLDADLKVTPADQQLGYKPGPVVGQTVPEGKPADEYTNKPEDSENFEPSKKS